MLSCCWLHIGVEKTGTTALQHYLAANRHALLAQRFLFPRAPGERTHIALTACALDDAKIDDARRVLGLSDAGRLAEFRRTFSARLRAEIETSGTASAIILSNEHLAARLRTRAELERLKNVCADVATNTRVIVYLRNQVDFLAAHYSDLISAGGSGEFAAAGANIADYDALLARWAEVFGKENLIVRRYQRKDLEGGAIQDDFARQLGIETSGTVGGGLRNRSLDAESIAFLRRFNRHILRGSGAKTARLRSLVVGVLRHRRGGTRFAISRTDAQAIEARFKISNEKVARDWFGLEGVPLFTPAASVLSEDRQPPGRVPMVRIALMLLPAAAWLLLARTVRRLAEAGHAFAYALRARRVERVLPERVL